MKKTYMKPDITVIEIDYHKMLCASIQENGSGGLQVTFDDETFEDDGSINAREFNFEFTEE